MAKPEVKFLIVKYYQFPFYSHKNKAPLIGCFIRNKM